MTVIQIKPHRNGWEAFEAPGNGPVFRAKNQAINSNRCSGPDLLPRVHSS
jgi:hypothetical protein